MNNSITDKKDQLIIYYRAGIKFCRGLWKRLFIKEVKGLFFVGKNVKITHGNHIICGKFVKFEDYSEIHGLCRNGIVLGDYVTISRGVMIRPSSYYGIDFGAGLKIGNHSSIGPYSYVGCAGMVTIGENVMFGPRCNIFPENHIFKDTNASIKSQGVKQKGIVIEDDVWIGGNVTILDGVTIGKGSVVGAGTIVTKDVTPGSIVFDKRIKTLKQRGK